MSTTHQTKVLIIGGGPAGYTAAIYAARANLAPIVVQGMQPGGQLTTTVEVENFPGFPQAVDGTELMDRMRHQAEHVGARMVYDLITEVDFSKRPYVCRADSGDTFVADAVIIATGAQARWLGNEPEHKFGGAISACATCDGFFYRGKKVAVVGGGNASIDEAIYLSKIASEVHVIHRRDSLRGEKVMQERLLRNPKITVHWNREVDGYHGDQQQGLTGLRLKKTDADGFEDLAVDGCFIAIGHTPATTLFKGQIDLDAHGYILTPPGSPAVLRNGKPLEYVWVAGDAADSRFRQAVTAAGMGCMAALEAERALAAEEDLAPAEPAAA